MHRQTGLGLGKSKNSTLQASAKVCAQCKEPGDPARSDDIHLVLVQKVQAFDDIKSNGGAFVVPVQLSRRLCERLPQVPTLHAHPTVVQVLACMQVTDGANCADDRDSMVGMAMSMLTMSQKWPQHTEDGWNETKACRERECPRWWASMLDAHAVFSQEHSQVLLVCSASMLTSPLQEQ